MHTPKTLTMAFLLVGSLFLLSCIADPWPEPDSMQNDTGESPTGDDNGNGGPTNEDVDTQPDDNLGGDSDIVAPDTGKEDTSDSETVSPDTDTETVDTGDSDDGLPLYENVFISTPNTAGFVTVVGLAGSVSPDSKVEAITDDAVFDITVGREGGFADRIVAKPDAPVTLVISAPDGQTYRTELLTGNLNEQFANGIVAEDGQYRLTETLLSLSGAGKHLDGGYFVVGGNITGGTSGMTTVVCHDDECMFSLILSAVTGDELDLFLVRNTGGFPSAESRAGTIAQPLVAD